MALNLPDARHQTEAVLLQNYGNLEVQAHGQGTIMIPQTTVNIPAEQLKDNIVWSLFSFVYGNLCCIGLAALIFSVKVSITTGLSPFYFVFGIQWGTRWPSISLFHITVNLFHLLQSLFNLLASSHKCQIIQAF
uniref:Uncharacterized protein n=1 Tax=Cyprinodon variegatus TaxID=28743 RepID=A0A3Q2EDL6_CYPVA